MLGAERQMQRWVCKSGASWAGQGGEPVGKAVPDPIWAALASQRECRVAKVAPFISGLLLHFSAQRAGASFGK